MGKFAIGDQEHWCKACGKGDGVCAAFSTSSTDGGADTSSEGSGSGSGSAGPISLPVAGVIGALVTLAVVLGAQALILVVGGLRVVSKKRIGGGGGVGGETREVKV